MTSRIFQPGAAQSIPGWLRDSSAGILSGNALGSSRTGVLGLGAIGTESPTWGQPIPVTWGRVKLNVPTLQVGAVRPTVTLLSWYAGASQDGGNDGVVSGADFDVVFACDWAVALGYPGDTTAKRQVGRIWVDGRVVFDIASTSPTQQQFAYIQTDETSTPDETLAKSIGSSVVLSGGDVISDQLAYRSLSYVVFYDFPVGGTTGRGYLKGVPKIEVEIGDFSVTPVPLSAFSPIGGSYSGPGVNNANSFYDWDAGLLYTVDSSFIIHKWNVQTGKEISRTTINTAGLVNFDPPGSGAGCFVKVNGKRFITCECEVFRNRNYFAVIDLDTGVVTDKFGYTNQSNFAQMSYPQDMISNQAAHLPFLAGSTGKQFAFVYMSAQIDGGDILWQITDAGKLINLGYRDGPGDLWQSITRFGSIDDRGVTTFVYTVDDGTAIRKVRTLTVDASGRLSLVGAAPAALASGWYVSGSFVTNDGCTVLFEENGSTQRIRKLNNSSGADVKIIDPAPDFGSVGASKLWQQSNAQGKQVAWLAAGTYYVLDMIAMTTKSFSAAGVSWADQQPTYDALDGRFYEASSSSAGSINVTGSNAARVPLSTILRGMCVRAGYLDANITIENIDDLVTGAILPASFNLGEELANLGAVYDFSVIDRDGEIVLTRRLRGVAFTGANFDVYEADRCVLDEQDGAFISVRTRRTTDSKTASKVSLTYIDEDFGYEESTYTYSRPDGTSGSTAAEAYAVPIVMRQNEAAALVARMTYDGWTERVEHEFRLPSRFLAVEPGDTINLYRTGYLDLVRVDEVTVNADFTIDITATTVLATAGPSYAIGDTSLPLITTPDMPGDGRAQCIFVDTPALAPRDVEPMASGRMPFYVAVVNAGRGSFPGASILYGAAGAASLDPVGAVTAAALLGTLTAALASTNWFGIDRVGTITFRPSSGSAAALSSVTTAEMLAGKNSLIVGAPGRWEVIGFETVTQNADGSVTLSGILRGMRGTDVMVGTHTAADEALIVDLPGADEPFRIRVLTSLDGTGATVKAGYDSAALRGSLSLSITLNENGRKPYAPVNRKAVRDTGTDDLTLTWNRRARSEDSFVDETSAQPLDETAETYDVEIRNAADSAVVRTISGLTAETYVYSAADQTTDGLSLSAATINLRIYQVSSVVGRGFVRTEPTDVE